MMLQKTKWVELSGTKALSSEKTATHTCAALLHIRHLKLTVFCLLDYCENSLHHNLDSTSMHQERQKVRGFQFNHPSLIQAFDSFGHMSQGSCSSEAEADQVWRKVLVKMNHLHMIEQPHHLLPLTIIPEANLFGCFLSEDVLLLMPLSNMCYLPLIWRHLNRLASSQHPVDCFCKTGGGSLTRYLHLFITCCPLHLNCSSH